MRIVADKNPTITGPIDVLVNLLPPDKRRRDIENTAKCLLDSLTHAGLWLDDYQISALHMIRHPMVPMTPVILNGGF